jgi:hypothetical protein
MEDVLVRGLVLIEQTPVVDFHGERRGVVMEAGRFKARRALRISKRPSRARVGLTAGVATDVNAIPA